MSFEETISAIVSPTAERSRRIRLIQHVQFLDEMNHDVFTEALARGARRDPSLASTMEKIGIRTEPDARFAHLDDAGVTALGSLLESARRARDPFVLSEHDDDDWHRILATPGEVVKAHEARTRPDGTGAFREIEGMPVATMLANAGEGIAIVVDGRPLKGDEAFAVIVRQAAAGAPRIDLDVSAKPETLRRLRAAGARPDDQAIEDRALGFLSRLTNTDAEVSILMRDRFLETALAGELEAAPTATSRVVVEDTDRVVTPFPAAAAAGNGVVFRVVPEDEPLEDPEYDTLSDEVRKGMKILGVQAFDDLEGPHAKAMAALHAGETLIETMADVEYGADFHERVREYLLGVARDDNDSGTAWAQRQGDDLVIREAGARVVAANPALGPWTGGQIGKPGSAIPSSLVPSDRLADLARTMRDAATPRTIAIDGEGGFWARVAVSHADVKAALAAQAGVDALPEGRVHALAAAAIGGGLRIDEYARSKDGKGAVATGRVLTGVEALQHLDATFGPGRTRSLDVDGGTLERTHGNPQILSRMERSLRDLSNASARHAVDSFAEREKLATKVVPLVRNGAAAER